MSAAIAFYIQVVYNTILSLYNGVAMYAHIHTQGNKVQRFFGIKRREEELSTLVMCHSQSRKTGFLTVSLEIAISRAKSLRVSDSACKGPER